MLEHQQNLLRQNLWILYFTTALIEGYIGEAFRISEIQTFLYISHSWGKLERFWIFFIRNTLSIHYKNPQNYYFK